MINQELALTSNGKEDLIILDPNKIIQERKSKLEAIEKQLSGFNSFEEGKDETEIKRESEFESRKKELGLESNLISPEEREKIYQKIIDESRDLAEREHENFLVLEKEKKILQYLIDNLHETEEFIQMPMSKECKVSIVIPVYGEREYIFRPLESLTVQEGVSNKDFEAIFVVNNPGNVPERNMSKETEDDYKRKVDHYHRALRENQEVLKILDLINGNEVEVELNPEEKRVVEKIKELEIRIFAIDKASPGKTLPDGEANVGGARNRGVAEAVSRFYEQKGENGIIAQTDGDSFMRNGYVRSIIKAFEERPDLVGAVGKLQFEDIGEIQFSTELEKMLSVKYIYEYLTMRIKNLDSRNEESIAREEKPKIHFSGANMMSRAYEAALVGGIEKIGGGEDPNFGAALFKIGKIDRLPKVEVLTTDRFSPRTDVDCGHGQDRIKTQEMINKNGELLVRSAEGVFFLKNIEEEFWKIASEQGISLENLQSLLSFQGVCMLENDDLKSIVQEMEGIADISDLSKEKEERLEFFSRKLYAFIDKAFPHEPVMQEAEKIIDLYFQRYHQSRVQYEKALQEGIKKQDGFIEMRRENLKSVLDILFENKTENLTSGEALEILIKNSHRLSFKPEMLRSEEDRIDLLTNKINTCATKEEAFNGIVSDFKDNFISITEDTARLMKEKLVALRYVIDNHNNI
ncbi:MAG: hypothetical protein ACD_15C00177G0003 [uncultured bacterium]|nr:MAG: hypothetical protein ACD_15C00177G0003 [uncultured bacterium]